MLSCLTTLANAHLYLIKKNCSFFFTFHCISGPSFQNFDKSCLFSVGMFLEKIGISTNLYSSKRGALLKVHHLG